MSDGSNFPQLDPTVTLATIADFSKRLGVVKNNLRKEVLAPRPIKAAPSFMSSQVAELCGIDKVYAGKEQAGSITKDAVNFTVKLKSAVLTEAQEEQIRNFIRELFDDAPRS